ncbi:PilZ domain-containing protein, partial [Pseudomonas sp. MD332_8]|uniref:PilZ domain-containing protein n=1 Tax=Pseudomonas sp. MD332_8 TaxID=3241257 RepID=UPI0036D3DE37
LLDEVGAPQPVIISEGGIDFRYPSSLTVGAHLAVKLVLMPQALGLVLRAKVTQCEAKGDGFVVGTVFESMTDAQRQ